MRDSMRSRGQAGCEADNLRERVRSWRETGCEADSLRERVRSRREVDGGQKEQRFPAAAREPLNGKPVETI